MEKFDFQKNFEQNVWSKKCRFFWSKNFFIEKVEKIFFVTKKKSEKKVDEKVNKKIKISKFSIEKIFDQKNRHFFDQKNVRFFF